MTSGHQGYLAIDEVKVLGHPCSKYTLLLNVGARHRGTRTPHTEGWEETQTKAVLPAGFHDRLYMWVPEPNAPKEAAGVQLWVLRYL